MRQLPYRQKTKIDQNFIRATKHLTTTKFYINKAFLNEVTRLVEEELDKLIQEQVKLLGDNTSLYEVQNLLQAMLKGVFTKKHNRGFFQKKLREEFKKRETNLKNLTMGELITQTTEKLNLITKLFYTNKMEKESEATATEVQKIFSLIYNYTLYLYYIEHLEFYNLDYIYFQVYTDFRGRHYYNSEASIQGL